MRFPDGWGGSALMQEPVVRRVLPPSTGEALRRVLPPSTGGVLRRRGFAGRYGKSPPISRRALSVSVVSPIYPFYRTHFSVWAAVA